MAPRTKPTPLRLLEGSDRQHPERMNRSEASVPVVADLAPPIDLDATAQATWDHFAPLLQRSRLLTEADRLSFAALCVSWSTYVQAVATVQRTGTLTEGAKGQLVRNPAALVAKDSLSDYMRLATEFGLTPSSRARIVLPSAGSGDPLADLLSA